VAGQRPVKPMAAPSRREAITTTRALRRGGSGHGVAEKLGAAGVSDELGRGMHQSGSLSLRSGRGGRWSEAKVKRCRRRRDPRPQRQEPAARGRRHERIDVQQVLELAVVLLDIRIGSPQRRRLSADLVTERRRRLGVVDVAWRDDRDSAPL
jgi:hypothetical protein